MPTQRQTLSFSKALNGLVMGLFSLLLALPIISKAESPTDFIKIYGEQCNHDNPGSCKHFDPARGQALYNKQQGSEWNCATCHAPDPKMMGEHCETHKQIQPMSPTANPDRFTDSAKVEKWFKRSCKDVLGRECTAQEKGDFLAFLISLQ